jgi:hypothetical protein
MYKKAQVSVEISSANARSCSFTGTLKASAGSVPKYIYPFIIYTLPMSSHKPNHRFPFPPNARLGKAKLCVENVKSTFLKITLPVQ